MILGLAFSCSTKSNLKRPLKSQDPLDPRPKSSRPPVRRAIAIWHLLFPEKVQLQLRKIDKTKLKKTVSLDEITEFQLTKGQWQVVGFVMDGVEYESLNSSQHFLFRLKDRSQVYAGTMIFQCPKVGEEHFERLKKMKFFNRYYFKSHHTLCEMVVGSDLAGARAASEVLERPFPKRVLLGF